jgi:hypothetical protein
MTHPPRDRQEFWIRFVCAALFFGTILLLFGIRFVDAAGLYVTLAVWAVCTLAISLYAALHGDAAWAALIRIFRWW